MRIKLIPENTLKALKASVAKNLPLYRNGGTFTFEDVIDTGIEVEAPVLEIDGKNDAANVENVFEAFKNLSSSIIRDERFWTHLTHVEFADYTCSRWPLDDDDEKAEKRVLSRYFASNDRAIENRNSLSRLYWIGYVSSRYPGALRDTVEMITYKQDTLLNFIERPEVLQLPNVFNALVSRLLESYSGDKALFERQTFREILKQINLACGKVFVECLPIEQVTTIVDGAIAKVVSEIGPEPAPAIGM